MKARAKVDLPAPRSPLSSSAMPGRAKSESSAAKAFERGGWIEAAGQLHGDQAVFRDRPARRCAARARAIEREGAENRGALVDLGEERHLPLMQFDEALDDGEAKAGAAMAAGNGARLEAVEGLLLEFGLDAAAGVGHPELQHVAALRLAPMRMVAPGSEKPMALESRLVRICSTPLRIGDEARDVGAHLDVERQVARCRSTGASFSATASSRPVTSTCSSFSSMAPASMAVRSMMASMMVLRSAEERRMSRT